MPSHRIRASVASRLLVAFVLGAGVAIPQAGAQPAKYPDRPIRMVVGFTAGGGTDVVARILAQKISERLGQSVLVENRTGASGMIAGDLVAKSVPDAYTLMMGTQTTFAVAPALYRKTTLDPARDFSGIAMSAVSPLVLVVHPAVPAQSVKDVIAMAKARPGGVNYGSGGLGTSPHMSGELFQAVAGIKLAHVAYRGEAPAINDVIGGQIPFMFSNLSAIVGNVRAGQLRAVGVTSAKRAPALPDVPTLAESGLPGFEVETWFALVAPAGTPPDVRTRLNAEIKRALALPDVKQRYVDLGMTAEDSTPESVDAYIKSEIAKWTKVIKDADIKAPE
jgi:tripartite-type tricarboxylate transporter receptor subunit TctC